jgi:hypothetical protein
VRSFASDEKDAKKPEEKLKMSFLQIHKDKQPPVAKPDSEYPDWLWKLDVPRPSLDDLQKADWDKLSLENKQRFMKLNKGRKLREYILSTAAKK